MPKKKKKSHKQTHKVQESVQKPIKEPHDYKTPFPVTNLKTLFGFIKANYLVLALLIFLGFLAYGNAIGGEFIKGDDTTGRLNSEFANLGIALKSGQVSLIISAVLIAVFGLMPGPFHFLMILIHIVNAFLVFCLAYFLLGKKFSLPTALLFVVFPAISEGVIWISADSYLYSAFFALLTINFYVLFKKTRNRTFFLTALGIFIVGVITHRSPWLLVTPLVIMTLDLNLERKFLSKKTLFSIPFLIVAFLAFSIFFVGATQSRLNSMVTEYSFNPSESAPLQQRIPYSIFTAGRVYTIPTALSFYHEEILSPQKFTLMVATTILLGVLWVILLFKDRLVASLMLAVLMSLAPVFSPVQVAWFAAERYMYLGGVFFCMLVAVIVLKIEKKLKIKGFAKYAFLLLICLYAVRTAIRTQDFKTSKNLWMATQKTAPYSSRNYNNLGDAYATEQNWPEAIRNFETAIKLKPDYTDALHNLGHLYMQLGDLEKAKEYLAKSFALNPRLYQASYKLALIAVEENEYILAKEYLQKTLDLQPNLPEALEMLDKLNNSQSEL